MNNEPEENFDVDLVASNKENGISIQEIIEIRVERIMELETLQKAIEERIESLNERKTRIRNHIKHNRNFILTAMQTKNMGKLIFPEATVSVAAVPRHIIITDKNVIPDDYWRITRTINLEKLNRAMNVGIIPSGTSLSNIDETTLVIRRK